jgi:TRAP-type C4-dicarboxylate transport system permease small subunit
MRPCGRIRLLYPTGASMVDRGLEWISRVLLVMAALLAFFLCFIVVGDVLGRVLFNSPIKGTPEIVSYSIVVICYLQAAYAIRSGGMINTDAITSYLSHRTQNILAAFGALLGIILFGIICWGAIDGAAHAWTSGEFEGEGALRIPAWPARFSIVLGTALAAISYFLLMLRHIGDAVSGVPLMPSASSSH